MIQTELPDHTYIEGEDVVSIAKACTAVKNTNLTIWEHEIEGPKSPNYKYPQPGPPIGENPAKMEM